MTSMPPFRRSECEARCGQAGEMRRGRSWSGFARVLSVVVLALMPMAPAAAQTAETVTIPVIQMSEAERSQRIALLAPRHRQWVQSVLGLITQYELDYFLSLDEEYRRDSFQEAFWKPRDPDPQTRENELFERWRDLGGANGALPFGDPRFLLFLLNGPPGNYTLPDGRPVARCFSRQRQLEIWFYGESPKIEREIPIILLRRSVEQPFQVYLPGENLRAVQHQDRLPTTDVRELCADDLVRYALFEMDRIPDYDKRVEALKSPPIPSREWLASMAAADTDPPAGGTLIEVSSSVDHPFRNQSRTATRVVLGVPRESAPGEVFDGQRFHHFVLVGEVIRDGRRLETFRYRFEGPTPPGGAPIPIGFTRFLRPGTLELRLLLEDVYGGTYAHRVETLEVPRPDGLETAPATERASEGPTLRLVAPPGDVHAGPVRFRTQAYGEFDKVTFYLDGESRFSKRTPPYSVELNLGDVPAPHRVRVVGLVDDQEVATDQIWLNQGAQRLRVGFVEPREGGLYPGGVTARLEVETPQGETPERVELFVGDEQVATLQGEPYSHALDLPEGQAAVLRAVVHLGDGSTAEDAILVGASAFVETLEVALVEVSVAVVDREGKPVQGLGRDAFQLFEDDQPVAIEGFTLATDEPVRAALMIDRSASMESHLDRVTGAARSLLELLEDDDDRLAVFSFSDRLTLDRDFTPEIAGIERALAGLRAGGTTAFYDALVRALQSFDGAGGALVVFTDGQDEISRSSFEQTLDVARGSAVAVYVVAPAEAFPTRRDRRAFETLAEETGGRAVFVEELTSLEEVYATLRDELAGRYLLTYTPESGDEPRLRRLKVEVESPGATVRSRSSVLW